MASDRILSPVDVEREIVELGERLERETVTYAVDCDASANAEADWKFAYYRAIVQVADAEPKLPQVKLEAKASIEAGEDKFRSYRVLSEKQRATASALSSIRTRLDAYRTLAANLRHQT